MSLETSTAKLCYAFHQGINSAMSQRVKSCVKTRAWMAAIVLALPLYGVDVFIYVCILWNMYITLSRIAGVPFWKNFITNVIGGFIVNVVLTLIGNVVLDLIPFLGWFGMGLIGYFVIIYSGAAYIEVLARIHGKNKVKETLNYNKGIESFKENGGINAAKGVATGMLRNSLSNSEGINVSDSVTPPPIPYQE